MAKTIHNPHNVIIRFLWIVFNFLRWSERFMLRCSICAEKLGIEATKKKALE